MNKVLNITDYSDDINLFEKYIPVNPEGNKNDLVDQLLTVLERGDLLDEEYNRKRLILRGELNRLAPGRLDRDNIHSLDRLLQIELQEKDIHHVGDLTRHGKRINNTDIFVWQGDITTLEIDAIVNAANSQMLGCFQPLHKCIDNAIHSSAGVELRDDCYRIMTKQGFAEPTGVAKITRGYNLPSRFVIHTVGPIVEGRLNDHHRRLLAGSYISSLDICRDMKEIRTIAFCCISTGVFGYPQQEAAELAYETVVEWLNQNPGCLDSVVFNVFTDQDREIYSYLNGG